MGISMKNEDEVLSGRCIYSGQCVWESQYRRSLKMIMNPGTTVRDRNRRPFPLSLLVHDVRVNTFAQIQRKI